MKYKKTNQQLPASHHIDELKMLIIQLKNEFTVEGNSIQINTIIIIINKS